MSKQHESIDETQLEHGKKNTIARKIKGRGQNYEVWLRLIKQPVAVAMIVIVGIILFLALFAGAIYPYEASCTDQNISDKFLSPSLQHPLGTDQFGRDQLARVVHGARAALIMGGVASLVTTFVATVLACLASYYGGRVDMFVMRLIDVLGTIPPILLAIAICAGLGNGLLQLIVAISIGGLAHPTRMIRSMAINVSKMEYIESAVALGLNTRRIMLKYIVPNIMSILILTFTSMIGVNIMMGATLSFIGLGAKPPQPEWGLMLNEAIPNIRMHVNLVIGPAAGIVITALAINTLGDYMRDAYDPQLKGKA